MRRRFGTTELHLELTHACPLNCAPCDHRLAGSASLQLSPLKKLFRSRALKGLRLISISGGEPTLHPRFEETALAAAGAFPDAKIVILTSLYESWRLERFLKKLPPKISGRIHIGSSLDGPPRVHNRIRRRAGAFGRLEAAHRRIKKACPGVSSGFTFTVSSLNAAHFYAAWQAALYRLGAPLGIQFLVQNPNTRGIEPDAGEKALLAHSLHRVLAEIKRGPRARGLYSAGEESQLKLALDFVRSGKTGPAGSCGAGRSFAMLSPEGRFYLCPFHKDITLGRVKTPFHNFWTDANARRARGRAGRRACSHCFLRCAVKV